MNNLKIWIGRIWEFLRDPKNREVIAWIIRILILMFVIRLDKLNYELFGVGHYIPLLWKSFQSVKGP